MQFSYDESGFLAALRTLEAAQRHLVSAQQGAARGWQLTEAGASRGVRGAVSGAARRSGGQHAHVVDELRALVGALQATAMGYEDTERRVTVMCHG